ncbi:ABC transporter permease [Clostridium thermosuccinogenes]|uniref:ABC transporter permease n=2 Tax=Clostridium thermosuccinogenes TaxID=84032 RepID=A0A2K2FI54_9CLOT|nr:ABC transporter permease [Pseudoclostridium thermosuccinogenes]PNT90505.1 ABC transporter permease [Pseudoclostridium thermosuccinogenes]PNT98450.1 ABC transporter permease [Pseudoclostridium thermosuccinogenes]PNU00518.1 ABC transporter permease [Pseudoclostridium thermosuccinogenes]
MGLAKLAATYFILLGIGFIYLYPVIYMIITSFMSPDDLVDPAVTWIPTQIYFGNFIKAYNVLDFFRSFINSLYLSLGPAVLQTLSAAIIGYALARFDFPLKKIWLILIIATFIIPSQVTLVPRYMMFHSYKFINTPLPSFIPAIFGQGIKSTIFILIFYQFFRGYPKSFDEAAELDGAGKFRIFCKIALPMALPALVVSILFSFVWYWNETAQSGLYFGSAIRTLPMKLGSFADQYKRIYVKTDAHTLNSLNEAISMAGTFLSIIPLLIMYIALQRQFVEGVERSGITGE